MSDHVFDEEGLKRVQAILTTGLGDFDAKGLMNSVEILKAGLKDLKAQILARDRALEASSQENEVLRRRIEQLELEISRSKGRIERLEHKGF